MVKQLLAFDVPEDNIMDPTLFLLDKFIRPAQNAASYRCTEYKLEENKLKSLYFS